MTPRNDTRLGIGLMIITVAVFAILDGMSRHLASEYNVMLVVMIRYWFLAVFTIAFAMRRSGGLRAVATTAQPGLQILRGVLLVAEVCATVLAFVYLGLVETHAIFASCPLIIAALSGPLLGERVGWRRWVAIGVGFAGILVILQPGFGVFTPAALIPLGAAFMFALYGLLTRYAARKDTSETSFLWTGVVGAVAITPIGLMYWEPMTAADQLWMVALCITAATRHFLLIKCYEVAEASTVQPFAYFQLAFVSIIGVLIFDETVRPAVVIGVGIVVSAGLFTLWRERQVKSKIA